MGAWGWWVLLGLAVGSVPLPAQDPDARVPVGVRPVVRIAPPEVAEPLPPPPMGPPTPGPAAPDSPAPSAEASAGVPAGRGAAVLPPAAEGVPPTPEVPAGFPRLVPMAARVRVPGLNAAEHAVELRGYLLRQHPEFARDEIGLQALVDHLAAAAADFRGLIDKHIYNLAVEAYAAYAQVADQVERLPVSPETRAFLRTYYAEQWIEHGPHRFDPAAVVRGLRWVGPDCRVRAVAEGDLPAVLLAETWSGWTSASARARVLALDFLTTFNPILRQTTRTPVGPDFRAAFAIAGQSDLLYAAGEGGRFLVTYAIESDGYLFLPPDPILDRVAAGETPVPPAPEEAPAREMSGPPAPPRRP